MPAPKPKLEFVEIAAPPPPTELTSEQAEVFKYTDEAAKFAGTDRLRPVRLGSGFVGYHYNPFGTPPPEYAMLKHIAETWIIIYRDGKVTKFPLVPKHDFTELVPSPSGRRFIVFSKKGPSQEDPDREVGGGHAVEVDAETLQTSVAITGTTGRSGNFLGSNKADVRTVWAVDYVDEDTLVASISENNSTEHSIVLLERGPDGTFAEVDRTKAPTNGTILRTGGGVISVNAGTKLAVFGVVAHQLVKLGTVAKPARYGPVVAHPVDAREELWFIEKPSSKHYRLVNHDLLLAATKPKKKKA